MALWSINVKNIYDGSSKRLGHREEQHEPKVTLRNLWSHNQMAGWWVWTRNVGEGQKNDKQVGVE